jgi:hypothetical protein
MENMTKTKKTAAEKLAARKYAAEVKAAEELLAPAFAERDAAPDAAPEGSPERTAAAEKILGIMFSYMKKG